MEPSWFSVVRETQSHLAVGEFDVAAEPVAVVPEQSDDEPLVQPGHDAHRWGVSRPAPYDD